MRIPPIFSSGRAPHFRRGRPASNPGGWNTLVLVLILLLSSCGIDRDREEAAESSIRELVVPGDAAREWPRLARDGDRVTLSWIESSDDDDASLRFAFVDRSGVSLPRTVSRSDAFFRNWADFPSVVPAGDSLLLAHWLVRGATGGYDYGIRVAASRDGGESWSPPRVPHADDTSTEHGFVTLFRLDREAWGLVWLDGRHFARAKDPEDARMALRFRRIRSGRLEGPEAVLDASVCDCCQTDAALTDAGPVVVYRDRRPGEIRDISIVRRVNGAWTEPRTVHQDGWVMPACPVNGPAVAARGSLVVVAWFTAAEDRPEVKVAFSRDGGASFDPPIRVDRGNPSGRVDVKLLEEGNAVVSWFERVGQEAEIRLRRVGSGGEPGGSQAIASASGERASGFPRIVVAPWGELLITWTEPSGPRIRVVALDPRSLPGPEGERAPEVRDR